MYLRGTLPLLLVGLASVTWSKPTVRLLTALPSPQPVGTVVGLTAHPKEEGDPLKVLSLLRYRYTMSVDGGPFRTIRDFGRNPNFAWRLELYEHEARVKVTVLNVDTKETGEAEAPFRVVPRAVGVQPVAAPTANPLVALFSFPACPAGSQFRVAFQRKGETESKRTGVEPCRGPRTSNMYVAGMRADSEYSLHAEVLTGSSVEPGASVPFRTGIADGDLAPFKVSLHKDRGSKSEPFLIYSIEMPRTRPMATDTEGNLVWYLPEHDQSLTRMLEEDGFWYSPAA